MESSSELRLALSGQRIVSLKKNEDQVSGLLRAQVSSGYCYVAGGHVGASSAWKHLVYWDAEAKSIKPISMAMVAFEAYRFIAPANVHDVLGYFTTKEENVKCIETLYVDLSVRRLREADLPTSIAEPDPEDSGDAVEPIE